ncbi:MAG: tetratricopeptide repeat protein [Verrucomicrobiae bacterium]|nr:tetratricopeptide repeat protein [Verrucomicrobiae bacterium]
MRKLIFLTGLLTAAFAVSTLHAESADDFLQAYFQIQDGDAAEKGGDTAKAAEKFTGALKILRKIKQATPDWNPNIIAYRIKYCTDHITKNSGTIPPEEAVSNEQKPTEVSPPISKDPVNTVPLNAAPPPADQVETAGTAVPIRDGTSEKVAALEKALDRSKNDMKKLQEEKSDLESQLRQAEKKLQEEKARIEDQFRKTEKKLQDEKASLEEQLGKAEKAVKTSTASSDERVQELLKENKSLKDRLAEAETKLNNIPSSTEEITSLRSELAKAQAKIETLQRDNDRLQASNESLKKELEQTRTQLKTASSNTSVSPDINPEILQMLQKENSLLRAIVDRHYQEDARRTEARDKISKELAELGNRATTIQTQLEIIKTPLTPLTEDEKHLLKTPPATLRIVSDDPTKFNAVVKASKSSDSPPEDPYAKLTGESATLANEAKALFLRNDIQGAAGKYEKILQIEPRNVFALSNLGVIRFRQERLAEGEKLLREALTMAPKDAFSLSVLGIVLYQEQKYDEAVSVLTQAVAVDAQNPEPHNYLGIAYSQKGYQEAAEKELLKAIELKPNYSDAHFNLAVVYASQNPPSIELARKHYKKATSLGMAKDPELEKLLRKP